MCGTVWQRHPQFSRFAQCNSWRDRHGRKLFHEFSGFRIVQSDGAIQSARGDLFAVWVGMQPYAKTPDVIPFSSASGCSVSVL